VKSKPGREKDLQEQFKALPEVREIHLITGKFDILVALESPETELDPRRKVVELVVDNVRRSGGVVDTSTILPIESEVLPATPSERPTAKGFVFIACEAGTAPDIMRKIREIPEVRGAYLLFGKSDILVELEVEKSMINPPPQRVANIVETRIAKMPAVHHTQTFVPLESIIK
jgi:DNA-binding Lrp family transcriptional regulator